MVDRIKCFWEVQEQAQYQVTILKSIGDFIY